MDFTGKVEKLEWYPTGRSRDAACTLRLSKLIANKRGNRNSFHRTNYFEVHAFGNAAEMVSRLKVAIGDKILVRAAYFGVLKGNKVVPSFTMIETKVLSRQTKNTINGQATGNKQL